MAWLKRLRRLFRYEEIQWGTNASPPVGIFPDYISCPHCGEPEIEVTDFTEELRCHNCGQRIEYHQR